MQNTEIEAIFELLDEWRHFPNYQLERRADIFFAIYLKQIIENEEILDGGNVKAIIPEFPVWKGLFTIDSPSNHSFKIDYFVICENKIYLIELKTDTSSFRKDQLKNMENAAKATVPKLMDGLLKIYEKTRSKVKYAHLLRKFEDEKIGWLSNENNIWKNISTNQDVEIVYIQPEYPKEPPKDIKIITFDKIAKTVEKNNTALSNRFAKSLRKWKTNPNRLVTL